MTKRAFVTQKGNSDSILKTIKIMKNHSKETNKNSKSWICHYCGKPGHIKPFCYKLHSRNNCSRKVRQYKRLNLPAHTCAKRVWKGKMGETHSNCSVALTTVYTSNAKDWYFDSGWSRHMTRNSPLFSEPKESRTGQVTFGDRTAGKVIEKGQINRPGAHSLKEVRFVDGLSANLISISQLCDQGFQVWFSKEKSEVLNSK